MSIVTTHKSDYAAAQIYYWSYAKYSNKMPRSSSLWSSEYTRSLAFTSYEHNYYTTYLQFLSDNVLGSIETINQNYYPIKIEIYMERSDALGGHQSTRILRVGCKDAAHEFNKGYSTYKDIPVLMHDAGKQLYTIVGDATDTRAQAQTYVSALSNNGYIGLGCAQKPVSDTNPMYVNGSAGHYMGITWNSIELQITWETRATKCTPPSTFTVSTTLEKPNTNIELSWSGATAGANNPISGYRIYSHEEGADSPAYVDVAANVETIELPTNAERGKYKQFFIQTKGTYGDDQDYWSEYSQTLHVTSNTLPSFITAPVDVVLASEDVVFSQTFSATSNDASQNTEVRYKVGSSSVYVPVMSGEEIEQVPAIGESLVFHFYPYDGLEYGEEVSITVSRKIKPIISNISKIGVEKTSQKLEASSPDYYSGFDKVTINLAMADNGNYFWYYRKGELSSDKTADPSGTFTLMRTTSANFINNMDMTSLVEENEWYQLAAIFTNEVESTEMYIDSEVYCIAPNPTIGAVYNNHAATNIEDTNPNNFYDKLRVFYSGDSDIRSVSCSYTTADSAGSAAIDVFSAGSSDAQGYCDISGLSEIADNTPTTFTITLSRGHDNLIRTIKTKTKVVSAPETIVSNPNLIKPHTATGTFTLTMPNIFLSAAPDYVNDWNITDIEDAFSVVLTREDSVLEVAVTSEISSDTITLIIPQTFYESGFGITNYFGSYNAGVKLNIENNFGQVVTKTYPNVLVLDFTEDFSTCSLTPQINGVAATDLSFVRAEEKIQFKIKWKTYNNRPISVVPQIARTKVNATPTDEQWENYGVAETVQVTGVPAVGELLSGSTIIEKEVETIDDESYVHFRVILGNDLNKTKIVNTLTTCRFIKHIAAKGLEIMSPVYTAEETGGSLVFKYKLTDCGIAALGETTSISTDFSSTAVIECCPLQSFADNDISTLSWLSEPTYSETVGLETVQSANQTLNLSNENWESYYIRIKLVTTDEETNSSLTTYSPSLLIYNVAPTVAYRKNHLGINTNSIDGYTDAILVMNETTGRHKIYMNGANGQISVVDISDGAMEGIIIDAGTW